MIEAAWEILRDSIPAVLAGGAGGLLTWWLVIRRELREARRHDREEREFLAPHIVAFWEAEDEVHRSLWVPRGEFASTAARFNSARYNLMARLTDYATSGAVDELTEALTALRERCEGWSGDMQGINETSERKRYGDAFVALRRRTLHVNL